MFGNACLRWCVTALIVVLPLSGGLAGAVTIDTVPVGNPGNADDGHGDGYGGVSYEYNIGKYEVTNAQYTEFLNAKASLGDPNGLYNTDMAGTAGGIDRSGSGTGGNPYVYSSKDGDTAWDNRPVNYVSFWDAARFSNWLHNGQGTGDTETGAYDNIGDQNTFARQAGAKFFIPTEDEWYKAAYYDSTLATYFDYPTGSDTVPTAEGPPGMDITNGSANYDGSVDPTYRTTPVGAYTNSTSPYGTFDQGGNLWEWNEAAIDSSRGLRGGYWNNYSDCLGAFFWHKDDPAKESYAFGFRVASSGAIPEPGSITLLVCGLLAGMVCWRRRR